MLATSASTLGGLICVAIVQRISLLITVLLGYAALLIGGLIALIAYLTTLTADQVGTVSTLLANGILLSLIFSFVLVADYKGVAVYYEFVEGTKNGFNQAVK